MIDGRMRVDGMSPMVPVISLMPAMLGGARLVVLDRMADAPSHLNGRTR